MIADRQKLDALAAATEYLDGLVGVIDALPQADVLALVDFLAAAYAGGERIFVAGNGGSAATAAHMACDLSKTVHGRGARPPAKRFAVVALADNVPLLTAWANDTAYERVFAEPLRNLAQSGDRLIVITGSGNSPNIVQAVYAARELGLQTFGLLGFDGGRVRPLLDQALVVNSRHYGHIEDVHMILVHLVTAYFVRALEHA